MDRGVWEVVYRGEELRDLPFFNVVDFFKGSDGGPGIFCFSGGVDRVRGVEDGGVGKGTFVGAARGRVVIVFVSSRHDREVKVREEGRVLIKMCEARGRNARER